MSLSNLKSRYILCDLCRNPFQDETTFRNHLIGSHNTIITSKEIILSSLTLVKKSLAYQKLPLDVEAEKLIHQLNLVRTEALRKKYLCELKKFKHKGLLIDVWNNLETSVRSQNYCALCGKDYKIRKNLFLDHLICYHNINLYPITPSINQKKKLTNVHGYSSVAEISNNSHFQREINHASVNVLNEPTTSCVTNGSKRILDKQIGDEINHTFANDLNKPTTSCFTNGSKRILNQQIESDKRPQAGLKKGVYKEQHILKKEVHIMKTIQNVRKNSFIHKLNRTSSTIFKKLKNDVKNSFFSIFANQVTTADRKKLLFLAIKYFNEEKQQFCTNFYRSLDIKSRNFASDMLFQMEQDGLQKKRMLGFSMGRGMGSTKLDDNIFEEISRSLSNENSNLIINRFIHKTLESIAEEATKCFPVGNLEFLIKETYLWFKQPKRQNDYKLIYKKIQPNGPIDFDSNRWIIKVDLGKSIVIHWKLLRGHFKKAKDYYAQLLYDIYKDSENKKYLKFITETLGPILRLNDDLTDGILDPTDFFENLFGQYNRIKNILSTDVKCHMFNYYFLGKLSSMLPTNIGILRQLKYLSPKNFQNENIYEALSLLKTFDFISNTNQCTRELRSLSENCVDLNTSVESFWINKRKSKNQSLRHLAIALLSLPISNKEMKEIFSITDAFENIASKDLSVDIIESILRIRFDEHSEDFYNKLKSMKQQERFSINAVEERTLDILFTNIFKH